METRAPAAEELAAFRDLQPEIGFGLGVIDIKATEVETADEIARRIERAEKVIGPGASATSTPTAASGCSSATSRTARCARWSQGSDLYEGICLVSALPARFEDVEALEEIHDPADAGARSPTWRASGDIMIIGVAGKMGPTLARMAKRAAPGRRVIGRRASGTRIAAARLEAQGVECIACDLLDREGRAASAQCGRGVRNVVFMAGQSGAADDARSPG